ncbi:MAG: 16S rRNA (adenine(1518)-N(6)/adenine(1519)-N(6))-dimethyltransferase RsmA [Armatimonadota bacterium]|nr:16S rRNA (adenine(1518)-N(6)/adenine(1519)-N(6))-dimethyltransferase RsmA [Armatimonadota bacterium]
MTAMDSRQNLTSPAVVKSLLQARGLRPKKRLGQSFLVDRNVLNKILDAADLTPPDPVLEIGAGLGVVTRELAARSPHVVAVETDANLISILRETLFGLDNVDIVKEDFLRLDLDRFLEERFGDRKCTVVTNLPYYITTPIITTLLEEKQRISRIVLMAQREVAQRLAAPAGSSDYSSITVFVRYACEVEIVAQVSRNVFYPPPDVDSALVRLDVRERPAVEPKDEEMFFRIVRASFGKRRKTLLNALTGSPELGLTKTQIEDALRTAAIDPARRGETLDLPEFARIADAITE